MTIPGVRFDNNGNSTAVADIFVTSGLTDAIKNIAPLAAV